MKFKNNHDFIKLFKKRLSEYTGAKYVVLTDSCTNALFLTLTYYQKIFEFSDKNIIVPNNTYIGVYQSIINAGLTPIYKKKKWKGKYKIGNTNIYDCAVGFKKNMYKKGQFQCLSFQQKKAIGIGKGGAILLDNKIAYEILNRMSWDGRNASVPVHKDMNIIQGYHMNMIPDDAAKGILLLNQYIFKKSDIKSYKDYKKYEK